MKILSRTIFLISVAVVAAVFSNRLSALIRVPAPALSLIVAAVTAKLVPTLGVGWRRLPASLGDDSATLDGLFGPGAAR